MAKGRVKFFNVRRGFGFITTEDGADVFLHYSDIETAFAFKVLHEGQRVEFEIENSPKGPIAKKVRPEENPLPDMAKTGVTEENNGNGTNL